MKGDEEEGLGVLIGLGTQPKARKGSGADSGDDGEMLAAKGILKAIDRGDAGALSRALKEHYEYCSGGGTSSSKRDFKGNGEGLDED